MSSARTLLKVAVKPLVSAAAPRTWPIGGVTKPCGGPTCPVVRVAPVDTYSYNIQPWMHQCPSGE